MKLMMVGDIVGKPGRKVCHALMPELRREFAVAFAIANAENAANGAGLTGTICQDLLKTFDVLTAGDHVWDQRGFDQEINQIPKLVRPANLSYHQPGLGYADYLSPIGVEIGLVSLVGKVFMKDSAYCPFETIDRILNEKKLRSKVIVVDFHAEATSEKIAMGHFLDGRVTAVIGTHTHVQTADAQILPKGTAYLSDVGMCGPHYSVLGRSVKAVVSKFVTGLPTRFVVEEAYPYRLDGAVVDFDPQTGLAKDIQTVSRLYSESD